MENRVDEVSVYVYFGRLYFLATHNVILQQGQVNIIQVEVEERVHL